MLLAWKHMRAVNNKAAAAAVFNLTVNRNSPVRVLVQSTKRKAAANSEGADP